MPADEQQVIEIDIATRIVGADEDFYVVRPGAGFSLYEDFQRENAVFLDFPDLPFALDQKPRSNTLVREIVARSIAIRNGYLSKKPAETHRDQAYYAGRATGRRVGAYIGAIQRLYYELPVGTVVIIPGKTYIDDVAFAEIIGPAERRKAAKAYPGEDMLVRPVRWLARKQKASLTPELRGTLGQPTPVMQIPRSLRDEVLKASFTQYVFKDLNSTRYTTTADDFSTLDDLNISMFNNYIAGLVAADEAGADKPLHLAEALQYLRQRRDLVPELDQSIASPGFQRIYSEHIAPLVIGALMTAALADPAIAQTTEFRIKNSAMVAKDQCAVLVEERVRGSMKLAHFDEFLAMCAALKETKKDTGLKTSMRLHERKVKKK